MAEVFAITGEHFYERVDYDLEPGSNAGVRQRLDAANPFELAGRPVTSTDRTDGWRFHLPEGWLLLRLSGTEPLLRVYTEVREQTLVRPLLAAGAALAGITGKA
jgi:phosphomannomutase